MCYGLISSVANFAVRAGILNSVVDFAVGLSSSAQWLILP